MNHIYYYGHAWWRGEERRKKREREREKEEKELM